MLRWCRAMIFSEWMFSRIVLVRIILVHLRTGVRSWFIVRKITVWICVIWWTHGRSFVTQIFRTMLLFILPIKITGWQPSRGMLRLRVVGIILFLLGPLRSLSALLLVGTWSISWGAICRLIVRSWGNSRTRRNRANIAMTLLISIVGIMCLIILSSSISSLIKCFFSCLNTLKFKSKF